MKPRMLIALLAIHLFGQVMAIPQNRREWKQYQARAHTPEEFDVLARWCRRQAERNQRRQAQCEAELRAYEAHPPAHPFPRNPSRDDALRALIDGYRRSAAHWSRLAGIYSAKSKAGGHQRQP